MVHERKIVVAVGVHVLQPSGELHVVDLQVDADGLELALELVAELGAVHVGVGEGQVQRLRLGVSGLLHELLGLGHVMRVQAAQILVTGIDLGDRTAEGGVHAAARGDDLLMVDGVSDGLADALVGELVVGHVEGEHELVGTVTGLDHIVRILAERIGKGGGDGRKHLHVAALEGVDAGVLVRQEPDDHVLGPRLVLGAPILGVRLEHDLVVRVEGDHGVRARAQRAVLLIPGGVLVVDQAGTAGEVPQHVRVGRGEGEPDRVGVHGLGLVQALDLLVVVVLLGLELVDGPRHVLGVELVAVGEVHLLVEVERVGQAILGDLPALGQTGVDLVVRAARDETLVHVADEDLLKGRTRLVADVKIDRGEFEADGHGVGSAGRAGGVRVLALAFPAEDGDAHDERRGHDDRDQRPQPPFRAAVLLV